MITDQLLVLADNQALTKSAPSTNVVDLLQDKPTPGMSKLLYLCVIVNEAITGTLQPILEDSADNSTYTTAASGPLMTAPAPTSARLSTPSRPSGLRKAIPFSRPPSILKRTSRRTRPRHTSISMRPKPTTSRSRFLKTPSRT